MQAPAIQEFGLFAGLGVLLAFVATMTVAPIALFWIGDVTPTRLLHLKEGRLERLLDRLTWWVSVHRRRVFVGCALMLLSMIPGIRQITEGTDIIRALKKDAPLRVSTEFIDQHLTGVHSLELLVQAPDGGNLTTPTAIRQMLAFSRWLRAQPGVTAVLGPWEPLRSVQTDLLTHDDQLKVLAALLPLNFPLDAWLDASGKAARLSVRVAAIDSERFLHLAHTVEQQAAHTALRVQVTGSYYLLSQMSRVLVRNPISSLLLAVALILGSIALALRSWKLGIIAAIPNLLPIVMIFGLMGWGGIELSTATTMIASVALGLFVDDTIHLLYRYTHEKQAGRNTFGAIEQSLRHTGRAVIFTSLILTLGFWAGLLGSFKPTIYFSFLTGLTMLFALLAELLVTPAAILAWDSTTER
jgi:predicted RND superfamily exporter protein